MVVSFSFALEILFMLLLYSMTIVTVAYILSVLFKPYREHFLEIFITWTVYMLYIPVSVFLLGMAYFIIIKLYNVIGLWVLFLFVIPVVKIISVNVAGNLVMVFLALLFKSDRGIDLVDTLQDGYLLRRNTRWNRIKGMIIGIGIFYFLNFLFNLA